MRDLTPFELRLVQRLDRELAAGVGGFDPATIAAAAIGRRTLRDRLANRMASVGTAGSFGGFGTPAARRIAIAFLVVLAAAAFVVIGSMLSRPQADRPLALLTPAGELALAKPDGTDLITLGPSPLSGGTSQVTWAPDGRHLALTGGLLDFAIVDRTGAVALLDTERRWSRRVAWAPDGRRFAMLSAKSTPGSTGLIDARLAVSAPDGSDAWTAPLPGDASYSEDFGALAWSRDGATIVVTGYRLVDGPESGRTWLVDVASRTLRELPFVKGSADVEPSWAPDGSLYVSRETQIDGGLWRIDPVTGSGERLVRTASSGCALGCVTGYLRALTVSPDGRRIAYVDFTDRVSVIDVGSRAVQKLPQPQSYAVPHLAWSSSGTALLFVNTGRTGDEPAVLLSVDVSTGNTTVITTGVWGFDLLPG